MSVRIKVTKGSLRKHGYALTDITLVDRRKALRKAVKNEGALAVFRKLNVIGIYQKNTNPQISKRAIADRNWVRKTFDSQFKSSLKRSKKSKK